MAENIENDKYWVRNMNSNGDYDYKELSDSELEDYLQSNPQAQGLMLNGKGQILPYRLSKIDTVKSMGDVSLQGIAKDKVRSYNDYEYSDIRSHAGTFKAMTNVLNDSNITEGTALYDLMVGTLGYESNFAKAGRKASVSHSSASGVMQITKTTFDDYMNRFGDSEQFQYIKNKWNNGKDIEWSDIENNDELNIAFALEIYRDRIQNRHGKNLADITHDEVGYLYANYYNTGDYHKESGTGHTVDEHAKLFNDSLGGYIDKYTIGRRYNVDYDLHSGVIQQATAGREKKANQEKANQAIDTAYNEMQEKLNPTLSTEDDWDRPENVQAREEQNELDTQMREITQRAYNEVNAEAFKEISETSLAVPHSINVGLNTLGQIESRSQKYFDEAFGKYATSQEVKNKVREHYFSEYVDALGYEDSEAIYTIFQNGGADYLKSLYGIDLSNTTDEQISAAVQASEQELNEILKGLTDEQREGLLEYVEQFVLDYNIAQSEVLDAEATKWGKSYNKALIGILKPKSDTEYAAINILSNSIIGKLSTLGADKRSRQIMDEQLASYNAGYGLQGITMFVAGLMDLPLILAGGAAGGAIFNGVTKLASNSFIKVLAQVFMKGGKSVKAANAISKTATNTTKQLALNTRLARMQLANLTKRKVVQFGINGARAGFSSGFGMGAHNAASQVISPYQFDSKAVWTSFAQGAVLGVIDPFKQIVPGMFAKLGGKNPSPWKQGIKAIGTVGSRIGFEATVESSAMSLIDLTMNGDIKDFSFTNAVRQESPFTLALGFTEWFQPTSRGAFGQFKEMSGMGRYSLNKTDWDNIQRVTGLNVKSVSDVAKLSSADKLHFQNAMNGKDMPIDTRNKFALVSGKAGAKVSFSNIGNIQSMEIVKEKDGSFTYQSKDAQGRVIFAQRLGYDEATAMAYVQLNRDNYKISVVNDRLSVMARVDYDINEPNVASIKKGQDDFTANAIAPGGAKYPSFQEAELATLTAMQKPYGMRTDAEIVNIENYNRYLADAATSWGQTEDYIIRTAMALDVKSQDVVNLLKNRNCSGIEQQMYDVYQAIVRGDDTLPDNDAMRIANERKNAKIRQVTENKKPADLTPAEEAAYLETLTIAEKLRYLNKDFISADDTVEFVLFSDGTTLVRVTEATGNVVYRNTDGKIVDVTNAQITEYNTGDNSVKTTVEEAVQLIQEEQNARAKMRDDMLRSDEQSVEGIVMYTAEDGSTQVAEVSAVNGLGDVTLKDGTVIPQNQVESVHTDAMVDNVGNILENGFKQVEDTESRGYWQRKRNANYKSYVSGLKESYPDINLSADINSKIASLNDAILKLETELESVKRQESEYGSDLSFQKNEIEKKIADKTKELTDTESVRDEYYKSFPDDKLRFEVARKAFEQEVAEQAKIEAEKKAEAEAKKSDEQKKREAEKAQKKAEKAAQKETESEGKESQKKAKVSEAELIKQKTKLMDFLLNPFNSDFDIKRFFHELNEFAKGTEMEESVIFNKVAFLKIGKAIIKGLKELHKVRTNLKNGLESLDPDVIVTTYKTRNSIEKNIAEVEKRLNSMLAEMEAVMRDYPQYKSYYLELKKALGENREVAKDVEKLLQPQPEPQQIITKERKAKKTETKIQEQPPIEESAREDSKTLAVQVELNTDVQNNAVPAQATSSKDDTSVAETIPVKEEKSTVETNAKAESKRTEPEPKKEETPKPKTEKKPKQQVPVKIKPKAEPKAISVEPLKEIEFTSDKVLNAAKEKHSLSFKLKLNERVQTDGKQGQNGYVETYVAEIEMSGYADNNSLGEAYDLLLKSNLYDVEGFNGFKTGDGVEVTNPKLEVDITYDKDGNIVKITPYYDGKGKITVKSMRSDVDTGKSIKNIVTELNAYGITVKYGNEGEFANKAQQAFYDRTRREIVINRNAELNDDILRVILGHEVVHIEMNPKDVKNIIEVLKREGDFSIDDFNAEIERIKAEYKSHGRELTDVEAYEEFIAEIFGKRLFKENGEVLSVNEETIQPLEIERFYERLTTRRDELAKQSKDNAYDSNAVGEELKQVDVTLQFLNNLMVKYKNMTTSKTKGLLATIRQSFSRIQNFIKARKRAKSFNKNMLKAETYDNVFAFAKRAVERGIIRGEVDESSQVKDTQVTDDEVYEYIFKYQNIEPYFAEFVARNPQHFTNINPKIKKLEYNATEVFKKLVTRHLPTGSSRKKAFEDVKSKAAEDYATLLARIEQEDNALYRKLREDSKAYNKDIVWAKENFPSKFEGEVKESKRPIDTEIDIESEEAYANAEEIEIDAPTSKDEPGYVKEARAILSKPLPEKPDYQKWRKDNGIKPGQPLGSKSKDWVAFQKDYQLAKEAYDKAKEVVQNYEVATKVASMYEGIEMQTSNTTDGTMEMRTEAQRLAFDAVMKPLREIKGIEVVEATNADVQRVLNDNGSAELMGSKTERKRNEIINHFQNSTLNKNEQAIIDAFGKGAKNETINVVDSNGQKHSIHLKQGNENKAGVAHSLYRHYNSSTNNYTSDELLLINDVIRQGKVEKDGNKITYSLQRDNVKYTVTTQLNNRVEYFTNFMTNRKPMRGNSLNTDEQHVHPQSSDSGAKVETNSKSTNINNQNIFRTSNGTIYGWANGNKIYLTKEGLNPNTPIHEYTHLWAKAMMNKNAKGWNSIKNLLRDTPEWQRVLADDNYKNIRGNEDAVASEVLSRMSGIENAKRMIAEAQKLIDANKNNPKAKANAESLLARIKQALSEFWNWVGKDLFGIEKFDSIEQITDRVLFDLVNKTDLGDFSNDGNAEFQRGFQNATTRDELYEKLYYDHATHHLGADNLFDALEDYYGGRIIDASSSVRDALSRGLVPMPGKKFSGAEGEYHHLRFKTPDGYYEVESVPFGTPDMVREQGIMFRINEGKMSGKEVGNYYRNLIKDLKLRHKAKNEFMVEAVKTISKHLAGKNLRQLVSKKTDIRRVLKQLGEIASAKMDIDTREKMLNDLVHELDDIVNENTAQILINDTFDYAKHINIIEKGGTRNAMRKSGKFAGEQETIFLETVKHAINRMTVQEIENAIETAKLEIDSKTEMLWDDAVDETNYEIISRDIDRLESQHDAYQWVLDAYSVKKEMRTRLKAIDEEYAYAKKHINSERKKNPNSDEALRLQHIIDNYRDTRSEAVRDCLKKSAEVTRQYNDTNELSKEKRKAIKENQKADMENFVNKAVNDMGGDESHKYESIGQREFQNKVRSKNNKWKHFYRRIFGSFHQMLSGMNVQHRGRRGVLLDEYVKDQQKAQAEAFYMEQKAKKMMETGVKKIFGEKKSIDDIVFEGNNLVMFNGRPVKLAAQKEGKNVEVLATADIDSFLGIARKRHTGNLSIQEAVQIILTSEQSKGMQMLEKTGISEDFVTRLKTLMQVKYPQHLEFGYYLRDNVVKYIGNEAQKVHTEQFGMGFKSEDNYYPLTATNGRAANSKGGIVRNSLFANSITPGFLITRTSRVGDYRVSGAYNVALQYVTEMGHWTAYTPMSRKLNSLLMNEKFARNVKVKFGDMFYSQLKDYANITVGTFSPGISDNRIVSGIYAVVKASKLALRPITALKQLYGIVGFHGYANNPKYWYAVNKNFIKALSGTFKDNEIINWALENVPSIAQRYESGVGSEIYMGRLSNVASSRNELRAEKLRIKGNFMNARADLIVVAAGAKSVYDYTYKQLRDNGLTHNTAHKLAIDRATSEVNTTQGSTESMYLSVSQRSSEVNLIEKGLTAFQTPSIAIQRRVENNIADLWYLRKKENRQMREDAYYQSYKEMGMTDSQARKLAKDDIRGDALKDLVNLWNIHSANAVLFHGTNAMVQMVMASITGDDEQYEKYKDELFKTVLFRTWAGAVPDLPVFSQAVQIVQNMIRGDKAGDAVADVIGETYAGVITSSFNKWEKKLKPLWEDGDRALACLYVLECLGTMLVGVDADTLNNYVMALYDACNGRLDKAFYEFLQMPPSAIKALEEVNESKESQRSARKSGITPENRGQINDARERMQRKMNEMRNRKK